MQGKRHFSFEALWFSEGDGCGEIYIRSQSHREEKFTPNGREFLATNGVRIISERGPASSLNPNTIFVRGSYFPSDKQAIVISSAKTFRRAIEALQEYKKACERWNEEMQMAPFWMVWSPQGDIPKYKHNSEAGAVTEADRLKALQPSRDFFVLRAEGWMRPQKGLVRFAHDTLPF